MSTSLIEQYYICRLRHSNISVLFDSNWNSLYDWWTPGTTQFKENGLSLLKLGKSQMYKKEHVEQIIEVVYSIKEFKNWLINTYFVELL